METPERNTSNNTEDSTDIGSHAFVIGATLRRYNLIFVGLALTLPASLLASEAHMRAFGPQSTVRVARPTVRWEVWPGPGSTLTSTMMTINGQDVRPKYDRAGRALTYTPSQPLDEGTYSVECKVIVDDFMPVTKSWKFKIAAGAAEGLPSPSGDQVREVSEINRLRGLMGLPDLEIDPRLCAAAMAHTNYLSVNNLTGHYQRAGDPSFVGVSPGDRLDAFGYSDGSWEGVDYGRQSDLTSINRLFDAPYHRLPFLQPGSTVVGAGSMPCHMTLEFGMSATSGVVVSPADGQRDIKTSWHGPESPDPLAMHGVDGVVGYPIVFSYFSPQQEKIVVEKATLRTALGDLVPFYLNSPDNDKELNFAALVIPKSPLKPRTGYTVSVDAHTASGKDISQTWRFVTGG